MIREPLDFSGAVVFDEQGYLAEFLARAAEEETPVEDLVFHRLTFDNLLLTGLELR